MNNLKVTRKVRPGKHGAVREQRVYGDRLLSVRYRTNGKGRYIKSAEIIIYDRQEHFQTKPTINQ